MPAFLHGTCKCGFRPLFVSEVVCHFDKLCKHCVRHVVLRHVVDVVAVIVLGLLYGVNGIWFSMVVAELIGTILGIYAVRNSDPYQLESAFIEDVEL